MIVPADGRPFLTGPRGVTLRVRLTPKGGRDAIEGLTETSAGKALKVRVRAAPEDGEANAALMRLIAGALDLSIRDVEMISGHKSRVKLLALTGNGAAISAQLSGLYASGLKP